MSRTTSEWQMALRVLPPTPYKHYSSGLVEDADGAAILARGTDGSWRTEARTAQSISLAPEAVAEVIRLREELEQMRHFHMDMCRMEASENGNPQPYYDIAKHIDRILNPEEEA